MSPRSRKGESLIRFSIQAGDVVMADRGLANRRGVCHVVRHQSDVVLRMNLTNLPLEDAQGQALDWLPWLRALKIGQAGDGSAWMRDDEGVLPVRVCAYKKTPAQTRTAQEAILWEAARKHREVKPRNP